MKYFIVSGMQNYTNAPRPEGFYKRYDIRNITPDRINLLPKRSLLYVAPDPNLVFVDILSSPVFMVTKHIRDVMELYEPELPTKQIILLDRESGLSEIYSIPAFKPICCLSEVSELTRGKNALIRTVLKRKAIEGYPMFKIADINNSYVVMRMDVVESILRRLPKGIEITQTEIEENGG